MIESKNNEWTLLQREGELMAKGEWITLKSTCIAYTDFEVVPASDLKAQVVTMIKLMQSQHESTLAGVRKSGAEFMSVYQMAELDSMFDWLRAKGKGYYDRVQVGVYLSSNVDMAESVERIVRSYQKILARLVEKYQLADEAAKAREGMCLAEWISDTPSRLALRLLQFGLDIGRSPLEGKMRYVEKRSSAENAASSFMWREE